MPVLAPVPNTSLEPHRRVGIRVSPFTAMMRGNVQNRRERMVGYSKTSTDASNGWMRF